jgi:hypothetical protein
VDPSGSVTTTGVMPRTLVSTAEAGWSNNRWAGGWKW